MKFITIKRLILLSLTILSLIWGVILFLAFSDPTYQLLKPDLPDIKGLMTSNFSEFAEQKSEPVPLKQELVLASGKGSNFSETKVLLKGAATPSAVFRNNQITAYFNFFPEGNRRVFGSIHQIKSSDSGQTWSEPRQIMIFNAPALSVMPFSPKAIILPNNKVKLYFLAKKANESNIKLFAAISDDGEKFVFDNLTSFEIEQQSLSSFALTILNNKMHLLAYTTEGATNNTAHHAVSFDTNVFTRLADVVIKDSYYGQNTLVSDASRLILYGSSDKGLWRSTSHDGNSWSSIEYLSFTASNPGILAKENSYYLFYTRQTTTGS